MNVPSLESFEKSDWEAINAAFQDAPSLALGQAWLEKPEENFRHGTVQTGWHADAIVILAKLNDDVIFTKASGDNQHLWTLGDVFEIFIKDASREEYLELHIAPNGHRLQLRFPSGETIKQVRNRELKLEDCMVDQPLFDFSARIVPGGWEVWARIPVASLGSPAESAGGMSVFASFSRYDYADEKAPAVLSSTSAHTELNYHRQQEWKKLTFTE